MSFFMYPFCLYFFHIDIWSVILFFMSLSSSGANIQSFMLEKANPNYPHWSTFKSKESLFTKARIMTSQICAKIHVKSVFRAAGTDYSNRFDNLLIYEPVFLEAVEMKWQRECTNVIQPMCH